MLPGYSGSNPLTDPFPSYPPITVKVNVAPDAISPLMNTVTASGGGAMGTRVTDSTIITLNPPVLSIVKSHDGAFKQGQQNATYRLRYRTLPEQERPPGQSR